MIDELSNMSEYAGNRVSEESFFVGEAEDPAKDVFVTKKAPYVLAFDTSNEVIALGIGRLELEDSSILPLATREIAAHRASNTQLLPHIDSLLREVGIEQELLACVICGRGPGSFTGVRIAMATAKGIASALEVPLFGISTLDSIAWQLQSFGIRGSLLVLADAMRGEVYPVRFDLNDEGIARLEADTVLKADEVVRRLAEGCKHKGQEEKGFKVEPLKLWIAGDGLKKYAEEFAPFGTSVERVLWTPTGKGLLLAAEAAWQEGSIDPFDLQRGNPAFALPVYTRLSDAEENERIRLSKNDPKNLHAGVQEEGLRRDQRATACDVAIINAQPDTQGIIYRPLDAAHVAEVACMEASLMASDAWNEAMILDELPRKDRVWWAAYAQSVPTNELIAYAGAWIIDGELQVLRIATLPEYQRQGIGSALLTRLASDGRDLGAKTTSLEVRLGNKGAQAFYASLGLKREGVRPHYYSNQEDAVIMQGPLPFAKHDVAGMELQSHGCESASCLTVPNALKEQAKKPLIFALETSCDETAAALIDGDGTLLSDVVASQIDFHARFGGVVPEIASRKHIEAICGVAQECLDLAAKRLGKTKLRWKELDAVSVTYAPGLVGALVVGLAFAKGAAWAARLPLVGVNHLEGHIYANKLATPDITPPMVVSLVSGGHTMLVQVKDWGEYITLGSTLDDAVGEAFDKVAKVMGLGYPGGPAISKIALLGNSKAIDFPRAMLHSGDLRFSLSGLKTAVITYIHKEEAAGHVLNKADIAASFQQAVVDVQVAKAETALKQTGAKEFCLGGGVAANKALREAYETMCARIGVRLTLPPMHACTDNAGMIALVALDRYCKKKFFGFNVDVQAHASLDESY